MRISRYPQGSLAILIENYIREMNGVDTGRPIRLLGESHVYSLRRLQNDAIGLVLATDLTKHHWIDYAKRRFETVCAATINGEVGYGSGVLKYAGSAPGWDCDDVSGASVEAARPFLVKHGYIGKSAARTRVPTDEEIERLLARAAEPAKKSVKGFIYAMPDIIAFALVSSRRIGEICSITHADVRWDHRDEKGTTAPIYWVRDMKHPTQKKGNDKSFPLFPALAAIISRQPRVEGDDRIFPFNSKSVGAKCTIFKHELGIDGLHFHDFRAEAITNWLKKLPPHKVRQFVSGHRGEGAFNRYVRTDSADGHEAVRQAEAERMAA